MADYVEEWGREEETFGSVGLNEPKFSPGWRGKCLLQLIAQKSPIKITTARWLTFHDI